MCVYVSIAHASQCRLDINLRQDEVFVGGTWGITRTWALDFDGLVVVLAKSRKLGDSWSG